MILFLFLPKCIANILLFYTIAVVGNSKQILNNHISRYSNIVLDFNKNSYKILLFSLCFFQLVFSIFTSFLIIFYLEFFTQEQLCEFPINFLQVYILYLFIGIYFACIYLCDVTYSNYEQQFYFSQKFYSITISIF